MNRYGDIVTIDELIDCLKACFKASNWYGSYDVIEADYNIDFWEFLQPYLDKELAYFQTLTTTSQFTKRT